MGDKHSEMLVGVLSRADRKAVMSFIQQDPNERHFSSSGAPGNFNSYNAQSGQIYGILKQMKETFERNLKLSRDDQSKAQKECGELQAAKKKEIEKGKARMESKEQWSWQKALAETRNMD